MKRLLSINNYHYRRGGSDVVYFEHAHLLEGAGWENAFFSMRHPNNLSSQWQEYFVDEIEFGHSYSLLGTIGRASKVVYSFEARRKLTELVRRFRPDVAHLHCVYHHLSPSIISLLRDMNVPLVMTAHDLKIACPAYKMLRSDGICERCKGGRYIEVLRGRCVQNSMAASALVALESSLHSYMRTYQSLDRIIVPSRFFLQKFVEWGWSEEKFAYIPNFVDADAYIPNFRPGRYFLYFGRLAPEKGLATLLHAIAAAGAELKIVGTGPDLDSLRELSEQLGVGVEFLGYQSGSALHDLIRGARATILPSEWYENAPMSVLESYALGKPVVGARVGGIPELVLDDRTGWTFPSGDVHALTDLLRDIAGLPAHEIEERGRACRDFVALNFNKDRYLSSIVSLYRDLAK